MRSAPHVSSWPFALQSVWPGCCPLHSEMIAAQDPALYPGSVSQDSVALHVPFATQCPVASHRSCSFWAWPAHESDAIGEQGCPSTPTAAPASASASPESPSGAPSGLVPPASSTVRSELASTPESTEGPAASPFRPESAIVASTTSAG